MEDVTKPSAAPSSGQAEQPTSSAELELSLRPTEITGKAAGTVPASEARVLITTFGMIAMGVSGIVGAVLTANIAPPTAVTWYLGLAVAELVLAFGIVLLIAQARNSGLAGHDASSPGPQPQTAIPPDPQLKVLPAEKPRLSPHQDTSAG
jgi:hypothetical protein